MKMRPFVWRLLPSGAVRQAAQDELAGPRPARLPRHHNTPGRRPLGERPRIRFAQERARRLPSPSSRALLWAPRETVRPALSPPPGGRAKGWTRAIGSQRRHDAARSISVSGGTFTSMNRFDRGQSTPERRRGRRDRARRGARPSGARAGRRVAGDRAPHRRDGTLARTGEALHRKAHAVAKSKKGPQSFQEHPFGRCPPDAPWSCRALGPRCEVRARTASGCVYRRLGRECVGEIGRGKNAVRRARVVWSSADG